MGAWRQTHPRADIVPLGQTRRGGIDTRQIFWEPLPVGQIGMSVRFGNDRTFLVSVRIASESVAEIAAHLADAHDVADLDTWMFEVCDVDRCPQAREWVVPIACPDTASGL